MYSTWCFAEKEKTKRETGPCPQVACNLPDIGEEKER